MVIKKIRVYVIDLISYYAIRFIKFYQRFISILLPRSCRYYPTCSEYSIILFRYDNPLLAFIKTGTRILRCNQLFSGGIDYPIVKKKFSKYYIFLNQEQYIKFWFIPNTKGSFFVIKNFK